MLFIAHTLRNHLNMHGQPSSGTRCSDFGLYLFQVATLCRQQWQRLHICADLTKPSLLYRHVVSYSIRHVNISFGPSHVTNHMW